MSPCKYPWMQNQWQQLLMQYQSERLPHALLLTGPDGIGKLDFAHQFVATVMCDKNRRTNGEAQQWKLSPPCGKCNGCQLLSAGTHPDSFTAHPDAEGKQIQIAAIREINHFVSLTSQCAPLQIVIIEPAEAMNRNSANALLKTLEEPRSGKVIMLITSQPGRLLPTIKSRCQQINLPLPNAESALNWLVSQAGASAGLGQNLRLLALAGGAPLLARQYAEQGKLELYDQLLQSFEKIAKKQADPVSEAKRWEAAGLTHCVKWLYLWVSSLIHLKSEGGLVDTNKVKNSAAWREPSLDFLIEKTTSASLYSFLDQLIETSRIVNTSVNAQLTLESLLMDWCQRLK